MPPTTRTHAPHLRDSRAVAELFVGVFRRDFLALYPRSRIEKLEEEPEGDSSAGPNFRVVREGEDALVVELYGTTYRIAPRDSYRFSSRDGQMVRAIGAVLGLRYHNLFHIAHDYRLDLFRGGSDDHYVAAFVEPSVYALTSVRPSRIASTILTLRTTALSTYENHRVSTGALLLGLSEEPSTSHGPTSRDAVRYGIELTALKSTHRLCDGRRTLFLVDQEGALAEIIDVDSWASDDSETGRLDVPTARIYAAHARATKVRGRVCLVLSKNHEIKLFTDGAQAFSFSHGRWRILDPAARFADWRDHLGRPKLARTLFQTALDLAESRKGGLLVVADDAASAVDRLIAPQDLLENRSDSPAAEEPLSKRSLHYLVRGRNVTDLDPAVIEALAGLDGALVTDRLGKILAFGAILRHDLADLPRSTVEGARTTAAYAAGKYGSVLKVSEDGVVSCFREGKRLWDL